MKVLHVIPAVAPSYGGPSQAVLEMCRALIAQGIEAEIATTNADSYRDLDVPHGREIDYEGVPTHFFSRSLKNEYKFSWPLNRWLKENVKNYNLLHLHTIFCYPTAAASYYARKSKTPYLIRPAGMLDDWPMKQKGLGKKLYLSLVERKSLEQASAIHYTSQAEKDAAAKFHFPPRAVVIPLGIHPDSRHSKVEKGTFRRKYPQCRDKKIILFLSRLHPKKGLELLIDALSKLSEIRDDFFLVIAGRGERRYEAAVKKQIHGSRLNSHTIFAGFLEGEEKDALLQDADIFALPSHQENFGIAIAEAMAAGLPVVVSDQVGISPEIQEYSAGIVVKCTVDSVKEGLERLIMDPELCSKMGKQGEQLVRERFAWDKVVDQLTKFYEKILTHRI